MATPSWTQQIDNMFTSTWAYRKGEAVEQAYMKNPFTAWLKEKGRIQSVSGYRRIEIPLEYGTNDTVRWIGKGSTVPMTEGELLTMAYEDWKYISATIMRYGVEDQQNRGAARIIDYVERKIKAAERAIADELERVVFADGSGTNEPNGLQNLVAASPSTGTVHGINRATYSWFRNLTKTASGPASTYLVSDMRNFFNTLTSYTMSELSLFFLLTTQTVFEAYEDEMLEMRQIVDPKMSDLGFDNLTFKGRPLMWAPSCPSGKMYFLNPQHLYLVVDPSYNMEMTEWKPIPDQVNDRVAQIVGAIQMVTSRPVAEGVLTEIPLDTTPSQSS